MEPNILVAEHRFSLERVGHKHILEEMRQEWISKTLNIKTPGHKTLVGDKWYSDNTEDYLPEDIVGNDSLLSFVREATADEIRVYNSFRTLNNHLNNIEYMAYRVV